MLFQIVNSEGTPQQVCVSLNSREFRDSLAREVLMNALGVNEQLLITEPGGYMFEAPIQGANPINEVAAVQIRLSGVSVGNRSDEQIRGAARALRLITAEYIADGLRQEGRLRNVEVNLYTVMQLDMEWSPVDRSPTTLIEPGALWVNHLGVINGHDNKTLKGGRAERWLALQEQRARAQHPQSEAASPPPTPPTPPIRQAGPAHGDIRGSRGNRGGGWGNDF